MRWHLPIRNPCWGLDRLFGAQPGPKVFGETPAVHVTFRVGYKTVVCTGGNKNRLEV